MKYAPKILDESFFHHNDEKLIPVLKKKIEDYQIKDIKKENLELSLKLCIQTARASVFIYFTNPKEFDFDLWVNETSDMLYGYLILK